MNKNKIKGKLLSILSPDGTSVDFTDFDKNVAKLKEGLKDKIQATTLGEMNRQLEKFKKALDFKPLTDSIKSIGTDLDGKVKDVSEKLNERVEALNVAIGKGDIETAKVSADVTVLRTELSSLNEKNKEIAVLKERLDKLPEFARAVKDRIQKFEETLSGFEEGKASEFEIVDLADSLEKTRRELNNRINNISHGGNANRNIAINGNGSVLSTFTDINLKAGANVTLSTAVNQTTKYTDITIAATGGAGTPGGADTNVQFNDGGAFGGASTFSFNKNSSILAVANGVVINGDGDTNNTRPLDIANATTTNAVRITTTSSLVASRSAGGQLLVSNGTTNTGNAAVFYSNVASALGRIVHITADNVSFDREALYVESDSTSTTALGVIGATKTQGVIKVTHTGAADGSDSNAAVLSLDAAGAGTDAQVLFINATSSTTGKLINARNSGEEKFVLGATGSASILGNVVVGRTGSVFGALDLKGMTSGIVRIQPASVAGNWTLTLPPNDGTANQVLTTDGNGIAVWASVAATGGSGITRTTSIISDNTTGDATAATDYVYIATVGLCFTLPDAAGNNNLYTLKNATDSSVLVTAIDGDTIDGSGSVLSAINNQSLDFISDGTNYRII